MNYLKSFKFWISLVTVVYTISGFFILPWFITNKVPILLKENIGINLELGKAQFNPYTFNLEINNIVLKDLDKHPVLSLKNLSINYTPLGLLEKTILFKHLNIDSPKLYTKIFKNDKINLKNILPPTENSKNTKEEKSNLPIIILQTLTIKNGHIQFNDLRNQKPFKLELGPYNFIAHDISTKKGDVQAHTFKTKIENGGELFWEGGMRITPLSLYGEINIKNLKLPKIYDYALPNLPADLQSGILSLHLPYQIDLSKELEVTINDAKLSLLNLKISNNNQSIIEIPQMNLNGFNLQYPKQNIFIDNFTIENSSIFSSLNKNYELNLVKAFQMKAQKKELSSKKTNTPLKPWSFLLQDTYIKNTNLTFLDMRLGTSVKSELKDTSLHVKNISSKKASSINYALASILNEDSTLKVTGNLLQEPLSFSSNIILNNLHVKDYVAYMQPYVNFQITNANIDTTANLKVNLQDKVNVQVDGNSSIKDLYVVAQNKEKLLTWKRLDINGIKYVHNPMSINIHDLKLHEPYIKAHIAQDGTTNFSNLINKTSTQKKQTKKESIPIKIKIGPMDLVNGVSDFSDYSLPFAFQTHIHDLNGHFSTFDFQTTTPSKLKLNGKIDKYGYTNIIGTLTPLNIKENAQLNLLFKNIALNNMTPYSSKFVGYKIKSGKLSMDLKYNIKKSKLLGDNKINIDTLTLGEKVDSPDAVNLPLELAIALLKDSDGQIDIDLPVKGNMNNPKFSYGGVIWRAVGNMITGLVTAPFKFLGNMLGIDGEKLKSIDFALASNQIINTEHEKLQNLEKILSKRPNIKLTIKGSYDKILDKKAFQTLEFQKRIDAAHKLVKETNKDKKIDTYVLALKNLYLKTNTIDSYKKVEKSFIDKKTAKLDILAFNKSIENTLISKIKIAQSSLLKLAQTRAEAIKKELTAKHKIDANRIEILPSEHSPAKRDEWIEVKLDIKS
ncbi:DUF748 domain-containing protein [Sulfurospirillum arcachonense]|uniref:DUF748 domain-containing protein n=1 Tax=Sulfurospirillum arcachonense TaxID=57666 RepID=UPI0004694295|nr:DUF748 domain-containing protein [Sulfurospirillum arcachonense]